jgi:hypothetical protein
MSTGVLSPYSQPNFLHFVLGEPFLCPVVELGRARAFVRRHFLGVLERTAIGEIGGNSGCPEPVAADFRGDTGCSGAPADHPAGVRLARWLVGQHAAVVPARCAEHPAFAVLDDAGGLDVGAQRLGERVMARHAVLLAVKWAAPMAFPAVRSVAVDLLLAVPAGVIPLGDQREPGAD